MGRHIREHALAYDVEYRRTHREARSAYMKGYRRTKRDAIAEQQRAYHRRDEVVAATADRMREYRQREDVRVKRRATRAVDIQVGRHAAREAVRRAVVSGRIRRLPCAECDDPNTVAHHHRGYEGAARLDVQWLCRSHHSRVHGRPR